MARILAVLRAAGRAFYRNIRSLNSITTNNFFWVTLIVLGPHAGAALFGLVVLALLFPLSADPLRTVPEERLALWPLSKAEHRALRFISPFLNPITSVLVLIIAARVVTAGLWAMLAGLFAIGFVAPSLTGVRTSYLVRAPKALRDIISTLDFYLAVALTALALTGRVAGMLPAEADGPITFLLVLALSSYAQCLFGLDGAAGLTRYRLLPVKGWQLLLRKGAAVLGVSFVVSLPFAPVAGLAAALAALAVGHAPSVTNPRPQQRWRFSTGASIPNGIVQCLLIAAATAGAVSAGWPMLLPCTAGYCISLWYYGRRFDAGDEIILRASSSAASTAP